MAERQGRWRVLAGRIGRSAMTMTRDGLVASGKKREPLLYNDSGTYGSTVPGEREYSDDDGRMGR